MPGASVMPARSITRRHASSATATRAAPNDVKVRYGTQNGFGFQEAARFRDHQRKSCPRARSGTVAKDVVGVWELLMILAAFVIAMVFIRYAVKSVPSGSRPRPRDRFPSARPPTWASAGPVPRSANELDKLALATERLRLSINMAIQRLTKKSQAPRARL